MTPINTGPTATTLHHILAALQGATGIDALWWLVIGLFAAGALAVGVIAAVDHWLSEPSQRVKPYKGARRRHH